METNNFKIWDIKGLEDKDLNNIYADSVVYDSGLVITLDSDKYKIILTFKRFISYRMTDESYLLNYWEILDEHRQNGFIFYKIENSSYFNEIQILSKDFVVIGGPDLIYHFAIFTSDECVEVISDLQPIIEIIEK